VCRFQFIPRTTVVPILVCSFVREVKKDFGFHLSIRETCPEMGPNAFVPKRYLNQSICFRNAQPSFSKVDFRPTVDRIKYHLLINTIGLYVITQKL